MTCIIYRNRAVRDELVALLPKTLCGLVKMKEEPYAEPEANVVQVNEGADGRVMTSHPFSEDDLNWLLSQMAEWIGRGDVKVLGEMPGDWVSKGEGE